MTLATDLATRAQSLGQTVISNLSPLYENGVFYQEDMGNYHLAGFPHAALMSTLAKYATNPTLKATYIRIINEVVNRGLETNTDSSGRFLDGAPTTGPFANFYGQGPDRQSMGTALNANTMIEQTANLAWILYQLGPGDLTSWASWLHTCQVNCNYLDTYPGGSVTTYWINGNYNCQLVGTYWLTALNSSGTDKTTYQDMYERALDFLVSPSTYQPVQFPSPWGLTIDVAPAQYDWSDGQAHLTETNTRGLDPRPDWDPNYSMIQLNSLARVFLTNRDTRLIRLINAIGNKTETRLNTTTWILDGSGGSRQNSPDAYRGGWLEVQALLGAKGTTTSLLTPSMTLARWDNGVIPFALQDSTTGFYSAVASRALGLSIAVVRHAAAKAALAQSSVPST